MELLDVATTSPKKGSAIFPAPGWESHQFPAVTCVTQPQSVRLHQGGDANVTSQGLAPSGCVGDSLEARLLLTQGLNCPHMCLISHFTL